MCANSPNLFVTLFFHLFFFLFRTFLSEKRKRAKRGICPSFHSLSLLPHFTFSILRSVVTHLLFFSLSSTFRLCFKLLFSSAHLSSGFTLFSFLSFPFFLIITQLTFLRHLCSNRFAERENLFTETKLRAFDR